MRRTIITLFALLALAGTAVADPALLKSNVVIVRPHYHDATRKAFKEWARTLDKLADDFERAGKGQVAGAVRQLSQLFEAQATSPGHGSGWVWLGPDGEAYVITNKHVAGQAGSVTVEFDGDRHPRITGGRIVYVDPYVDMAVIQVPRPALPAEATGFQLIDTPLTEGSPVWASGFPGTVTAEGMEAIYSLTIGNVSNASFPGPSGPVIAHSATIDPGNSGGPLLVEDPTVPLGFKIAGMNTWKSTQRTNVNMSLPTPAIERVLQAALESRRIAADRGRMASALRATANRLAVELGSAHPDIDALRPMIAYSFVAARPGIIGIPLQQLFSGKLSEDRLNEYLASPVEYSRTILSEAFYATFSTGNTRVGAVRLEQITDEDRIGTATKIRSLFSIAGENHEITWAWEHGAWRIADASFEQALGKLLPGGTGDARGSIDVDRGRTDGDVSRPAGAFVERKRGVSLALRAGFGDRTAAGVNGFTSTLEPMPSRGFDVELGIPLNRYVGITLGVGYNPLGAQYPVTVEGTTVTIKEEATYLQVPAGLRLELPIARRWGTVRLSGRAAIAADILIQKGGTYENNIGGMGQLNDPSIGWYDEHNVANVAALYGGGVEIGFGKAPSVYLGLDLIHQQHLLDEWTDAFFTGGANYRYSATRMGLFIKYQGLR